MGSIFNPLRVNYVTIILYQLILLHFLFFYRYFFFHPDLILFYNYKKDVIIYGTIIIKLFILL